MTPDQKLKQAQDDLRRAERAVQEARDELAKKESPKFIEADVVPGARFWSPTYKNHVIVVGWGYTRYGEEKKYGVTGRYDAPFGWWSNGPFTLAEMVAYVNDPHAKRVKTPGKWVFEPENPRA